MDLTDIILTNSVEVILKIRRVKMTSTQVTDRSVISNKSFS